MNRREIYIYLMIQYYQAKQQAGQSNLKSEEGKVIDKVEKRKKITAKKIKVNKKWFIENYDKIQLTVNIREQFGLERLTAGEIYTKFLGEKKPEFNRGLYDIVNSFYVDEKIPKRIVELD